jgi:hypothetical protein
MKKIVKFCAAVVIVLGASSSAYANPCLQSAAHLQREVDGAIDEWVGSGPWKRESIDALRGHQPTPYSLATAATGNAAGFEDALDALDRARAAGNAGDDGACARELAHARAELRRYGR